MAPGTTLFVQQQHQIILKITKQSEDVYNNKNAKAIKALYKDDATVVS
jgi:hypothetical protein